LENSKVLKASQDAYGHQLYDFFKGRQVVEVVERDDGLIDPSESLPKYYLSEYKDWNSREKIAAGYVKGKVLDIGSGGGRWTLFLQKKGHVVLGIDISPLALKVCRERGVRNAMLKPISEIDSSLGKFDTILMMGNNFGLFENRNKARRLLKRFHEITSPRARIVAESLDIYKPPVDRVHRQYHLRNRRRGRMPGQVRIRIRYLTYASSWFDYLLVSKPEMIGILRGTGWKVRRFIPSKKSPMYVAIIEKETKR
jgi:SAM-dependent methyltransferase